MLLVRILGIKRIFASAPLNIQALRARDVHSPTPGDTLGLKTSTCTVMQTIVTEITPDSIRGNDVILYCPGGSFVSGPAKFNWRSIARIVKETGLTAFMVDYPKAPESKIDELNQNIDAVYHFLRGRRDVSDIVLLGGSVGATLVTLLVQRLVKEKRKLPGKLILITPMMDAAMSNPAIRELEGRDTMYARSGVLEANKICAGEDLKRATISPLSGSFQGFPPTLAFVAENDIQSPDALLFCEKLRRECSVRVEHGKGMPHIWPLLPMREGRQALGVIADFIRNGS